MKTVSYLFGYNENSKGDGLKLAIRRAEKVRRGMVFSLKKKNKKMASPISEDGVNLPLSSELTTVKKPKEENDGRKTDFSTKGDTKQSKKNWQPFKNNSKLNSRTPRPKKKEVTITSTGPFNGFDIKVKRTHLEDYKYLHFSALKVIIDFEGTFSNGQRINSKHINAIKHSAGFADKLKELILQESDTGRMKVQKALASYDPQKMDDFTKKYNGAPVETRYKYGRLAFDIYLTTTNYRLVKENIKKQVDCFVESDTKNLRFLNKKY